MVRAVVEGVPVANQLVIAGGEDSNGSFPETSARTDEEGVARFDLHAAGLWYVKFISMEKVGLEDVDYESKWATLTFEVR